MINFYNQNEIPFRKLCLEQNATQYKFLHMHTFTGFAILFSSIQRNKIVVGVGQVKAFLVFGIDFPLPQGRQRCTLMAYLGYS